MYTRGNIPDHINVFQQKNPNMLLTADQVNVLTLLNKYHLTFVEQFYLDMIGPSRQGHGGFSKRFIIQSRGALAGYKGYKGRWVISF